MRRKRLIFALVASAFLAAPAAHCLAGPASGPTIIPAGVHDVSPPLSKIPPATGGIGRFEAEREILPKFFLFKDLGADPLLPGHGKGSPVQSPTAPSLLFSFEGGGAGLAGFLNPPGQNYIPPDTNGDVGLNHYVQWLNAKYTVFNKATGAVVLGPVNGRTLWTGFPTTDGNSCATHNDGDPIVQYDQLADRWVLTQFDVPDNGANYQCVAISTTGDPTGSYYRYDFKFTTYFNDYPKLGVWPDAYYMTWNFFDDTQPGQPFVGGEACALDRTNMLAGNAATAQCFGPIYDLGGSMPPDLDGSTLPPDGEAAIFVTYGTDLSSNPALLDWKFHVDWATPANSTFTGPNYISTATFTPACASMPNPGIYSTTCIPQKGSSVPSLDSLSDLTMYRLAYRNRGGTESLLVNQSVNPGIVGTGVSGVRWYELRLDVNGDPSVFQQGTFAPADGLSRWMGSLAMDMFGNIAVGYSTSSGSAFPSIRFAGRAASDPSGTLSGETTLQAGSASQTYFRWGDYTTMSVDPSDDCTFWYTGEYLTSTGMNWRTRIGSIKFPVAAPAVSGSTVVCAGDPISLSATAGFDRYQWYLGSSAIGGATSQSYSVAATSGADQGTYTAVGYYGNCSSAVSANFPVTVDSAATPAISGPTALCAGQQLQLTATAGGSSYQWSLGGNPISGANAATYTVASASVADAGDYTVTLTDAASCPSLASPVLHVNIQACAVEVQALSVDSAPNGGLSDGNGIFEPGETVIVDPTWKNVSLSPDPVTGAASAYSGPVGAVYSTVNSAADYGSIAAGGTTDCLTATSNCFALGVNSPVTRPAVHWDAQFTETPSDGSSAKIWTLHLGNSFSDVPKSDVFYGLIETLLHNNVTVGCGTGTHGQGLFCPNGTVTREQMAAFIARALTGGDANIPVSDATGSHPYDCAGGIGSNFTDVPAGYAFCPQINWIFNHGITNGCGPATYCPSAAIPREQMATLIARARAGSDAAVDVAEASGPHPYDCTSPVPADWPFTDVPNTNIYCKYIGYLHNQGVVNGYAPGYSTFGPTDTLTRGQSSVFISVGLNLKLYGP